MDCSSHGGGLDHEVRPGKPHTLIRRRLGFEGLEVSREAELLDVIRQHTSIPIPRVLRLWRSRQTMEQSRLPGRPLLELLPQLTEQQAVRLGGELGEFIVDLARVPRLAVAHLVEEQWTRPEELFIEAKAAYEQVGARLPTGCVRRVEEFLGGTVDLRMPEAVLIHQDLGAEHVFVMEPDPLISGIIDFSDACLGDPAIDLGLILRDLGPGAAAQAVARCAAGGLATRGLAERSKAYARFRTLEDLAFGLRHGRRDYWTNAVRAAVRLFGHG